MTRLLFLRHGATQGNLARRYIGVTDEPLCPAGVAQAQALARSGTLPAVGRVYASPLLRCRQTAALLFPCKPLWLRAGLRECDFGRFEGRTAAELAGDPDYARWLATGCTAPLPGGESVAAFRRRVCRAVEAIVRREGAQPSPEAAPVALVTHGGCIMAALAAFDVQALDFYDYHLPNCGWLLCEAGGEDGRLRLRVVEGSALEEGISASSGPLSF